MADFHQTGVVSTLHRFGNNNTEVLEAHLFRWRHQCPVALVLPSLYSEFEGPAMAPMLKVLKDVTYLKRIVLTLAQANADQFQKARAALADLPTPVRVVWNDGPRVQALYKLLKEADLPVGEDGKGRSCWMAYGFILAAGDCDAIVLHDADILTYTREFLARLCYPIGNPNLDYRFCKGYYARITDKMHGRVTRLLVTPLIRSLQTLVGPHPFLAYLDSFRYPLAGEFGMKVDLARLNRIPADWGLEIGVLAEVYRTVSVKRVCQVELCEAYEHKHQTLDPAQTEKGLMKMAVDICKNLFRFLAADGILLTEGSFMALLAHYVRMAEDMIVLYHADALINGLTFDRHEEESAVAAFAQAVRIAAEAYRQDPLGIPQIPNWNRVTAAFPDFFEKLMTAVEEDNA